MRSIYFDIGQFDDRLMPTRYQGTERERLALDAFIKLSRCMNAVQGKLLPSLQRDFGLTESQIAILEALHHLGPLTQGELCRKILRSGSNVTTVIDNLERAGLVRRERGADDRRIQVAHLTEAGRSLLDRALPAHVERITTLMGKLEPDEQRDLGRLCRKLGRAVAE
ncbi:MAG TPA: MarR family transcriptional regulator [Gemmatimonadaceae bacterium]|nr:MarR family transcriptional regulator [Gemmatimonadaceae bacterium]